MIFEYLSVLPYFRLSEDQRNKKVTFYDWYADRDQLEKLVGLIKRKFCEKN